MILAGIHWPDSFDDAGGILHSIGPLKTIIRHNGRDAFIKALIIIGVR